GGEALDLLPGALEAVRRVEVGQPAVAVAGDAAEHGVDVAADQDRRARLLHGVRQHARIAQVELVELQPHLVLGQQAGEDLQVAVHDPAALFEVDAHGAELAGVPADGRAEDEAALRDVVEATDLLGQHGRVAQRQDQDAGAELDPAGAHGDRREDRQRVDDREGRLDAQDDVVPGPQRLVAELLGALGVGQDLVDVGRLRRTDEVFDSQAEADAHPKNLLSASRLRRIASSVSVGGSVTATCSATSTSKPVCSRTSSIVTFGCRASRRIARETSSNPNRPRLVMTCETVPKQSPAWRRASPPSRKPGLVTKSTRGTKRRFSCIVTITSSLHSEAISFAPPVPGSRTRGWS